MNFKQECFNGHNRNIYTSRLWRAPAPAPPMQIASQCPTYRKHPKQTGVDTQLTDLAGLETGM